MSFLLKNAGHDIDASDHIDHDHYKEVELIARTESYKKEVKPIIF